MSYTPQNLELFNAAFNGALAGMERDGISAALNLDVATEDFADEVAAAGAFAQAVDSILTGPSVGTINAQLIYGLSIRYWKERRPMYVTDAGLPATYIGDVNGIGRIAIRAKNYYVAEGITV